MKCPETAGQGCKSKEGGRENLELFPGCNIFETSSSYWPEAYLALQQSQRVIKLFYQQKKEMKKKRSRKENIQVKEENKNLSYEPSIVFGGQFI